MFFLSILSPTEVIFPFENKIRLKTRSTFEICTFGTQRAMIATAFFNAVINWSCGVCLGAEQFEQWYA